MLTFLATLLMISIILGISFNKPAPPPFPATFFTGHPKFKSIISGLALSAILAASVIDSTSLPYN